MRFCLICMRLWLRGIRKEDRSIDVYICNTELCRHRNTPTPSGKRQIYGPAKSFIKKFATSFVKSFGRTLFYRKKAKKI